MDQIFELLHQINFVISVKQKVINCYSKLLTLTRIISLKIYIYLIEKAKASNKDPYDAYEDNDSDLLDTSLNENTQTNQSTAPNSQRTTPKARVQESDSASVSSAAAYVVNEQQKRKQEEPHKGAAKTSSITNSGQSQTSNAIGQNQDESNINEEKDVYYMEDDSINTEDGQGKWTLVESKKRKGGFKNDKYIENIIFRSIGLLKKKLFVTKKGIRNRKNETKNRNKSYKYYQKHLKHLKFSRNLQ